MTKQSSQSSPLLSTLDKIAYVVSVIAIGLVVFMRPEERYAVDFDTSWMPGFHAAVNTLGAFCLVGALIFIKQKKVKMHRNMIFAALVCSFFFFISYIVYHFTTPETKYCGEGTMRTVYFTILISHIILAGLSLPFILLTFNRGITYTVEKHKKMARWVFPVWLYVMITGPLVYIMLKPCYNF